MLTNPNRIGEERKDGQGCHLSCSTTTTPQTRGKWLGLEIFVHLFLGNVVCHLWIKGPPWPSPVCDIGARTHPQNEQWPLLNVESRRKPVTPNNCHILLWLVIGRTAGSPSPSTGDEVAVTGLKRPCLVCQQRGGGESLQLLRPSSWGCWRVFPPTSCVWLWFLRGQMVLLQRPPWFSWTETSPKVSLIVCCSSAFCNPLRRHLLPVLPVWKDWEARRVDNEMEPQIII